MPRPTKAPFSFALPLALALTLAICFGFLPATAQNNRVKDPNNNAWLMYFGDHRLTNKVGVHTEVQIRRANFLSDWQQLLLRTGVNFYPLDNTMLTLGYAYIDTHPYGDNPAAATFPEHRLYEQLQIRSPLGRLGLVHRYRLEQRWVTFPNQAEATYLDRVRYMFRATLPLQGPSIDDKEFFLAAYDEVMIGFGKNVTGNVFDQNRLYGALGFRISPAASVELGYLNQIVQQRNGRIFEHNHTLQAALYYNLDLRQKGN